MRASMWLLPLLIMAGCGQPSGVTTVNHSSVDGEGVYSTKTWINGSTGRFECRKSASGQCHYVLFTENCGENGARPIENCETKVMRQFALKAGEMRVFNDLPPGVKHCLNHDAAPVAPGCGKR